MKTLKFLIEKEFKQMFRNPLIANLIIGHIPFFPPEAVFIMSAIIVIMFGRLGVIGLRVRNLKIRHGFVNNQIDNKVTPQA